MTGQAPGPAGCPVHTVANAPHFVGDAVRDDHQLDVHPHAEAPFPPIAGPRPSASGSADHLLHEYADGPTPYFPHHTMARPRLQATNVCGTLLMRFPRGEGVAVRLDSRGLPVRLRPGHFGGLDRRRAHMQAVDRRGLRRRVGLRGIRTRLENRRRAGRQ